MLIIALVLALIGLVALVFAVVTSNELVAWVCIGASVLGVVLLIIDAVRERHGRAGGEDKEETPAAGNDEDAYVDYPEDAEPDTAVEATPEASADKRGDETAK
jgi:hypothetical protein